MNIVLRDVMIRPGGMVRTSAKQAKLAAIQPLTKTIKVACVVMLGIFGILVGQREAMAQLSTSPLSENTFPLKGTVGKDDANDTQYLVFWPPLPGTTDDYETRIRDFVSTLGTRGDGKTRQLGFSASIPFWVDDESTIAQTVTNIFDLARRTEVAIYFNVDDHLNWDARPDLWNWYDPAKKGYNPGNRKNVEWFDWDGKPSKRRYFSPREPHLRHLTCAIIARLFREK